MSEHNPAERLLRRFIAENHYINWGTPPDWSRADTGGWLTIDGKLYGLGPEDLEYLNSLAATAGEESA